jgi:hypothetical protein
VSGLILPNGKPARGGLTIHVPSGYETEQDLVEEQPGGGHICRVIVDGETREVCGRTFPGDQEGEYLRHLRRCVSAHRDAIHAASPRTRVPLLDPNLWDPEVDEHMRKVGRRMVEEGRLTVNPSERAGFA